MLVDNRPKISVRSDVILLAPIFILVFPLRWILAFVFAAITHEIWHLAAICLFGGRVLEINIGGHGAEIVTDSLPERKEIIAALAGPFGSLSTLLFYKWIPCTAFCGLIHALFNMLPLYPLDGGRVLACIFRSTFSDPVSRRISFTVNHFVLCSLLLGAIVFRTYFIIWGLCLPLILSDSEKYLAKTAI